MWQARFRVLVVALLASSCGGGSDSPPEPPTSSGTAPEPGVSPTPSPGPAPSPAPTPPAPPPSGATGLDFPSNQPVAYSDIRFTFTGANLLPMQPATYIWNVMPRQQAGFYTTFFHAPDGALSGGGDYYGAHPYPNGGSSGNTHKWEISTWGYDYVTDVNGNSTEVQYGRWHTQALVVANNVLTFYYDLPNTSKRIVVNHPGLNPRSGQALTFGDAPWNLHSERLSGVLRGIRLYSTSLSINDILAEANAPLSTSAGAAAIWYMNMNPTPSDISDKSSRGHHPAWASSARPALWTQ